MKIFLTGGTGFIGSHVLKELLGSNIEVIAHRRKETSLPKIPIEHPIFWLTKPVSELKSDDFVGVDVLIHLASHSVQYPFDSLENNIHFNVVEPIGMFGKAHDAGVTKYLVAGSCFEYGLSGERYEYIPTSAPLEPTNDYATSKAMSYLAFRQFALNKDICLSYLRFFHIYGQGEPPNRLWPSVQRAANEGDDFFLTSGEQVRDFLNVKDLAYEINARLFDLNEISSKQFVVENLGSGKPQSVKDFVSDIWMKTGAKGNLVFGAKPYRQGEVMRYVPEINS